MRTKMRASGAAMSYSRLNSLKWGLYRGLYREMPWGLFRAILGV